MCAWPHLVAVDSDGEVNRLPAKVEHDFPGIGQRTMLINANRVVRLESSTSKELLHRAHDLFLAVDKAIMRGTQQFNG